jgi:hypothetical protein
MTSWLSGPGYCKRFGGEGTGAHCIIPVTLVQGREYDVVVEFVGRTSNNGVMGSAWRGTITDVAANVTTVIGTLFHPDYNGAQGYGLMTIDGTSRAAIAPCSR